MRFAFFGALAAFFAVAPSVRAQVFPAQPPDAVPDAAQTARATFAPQTNASPQTVNEVGATLNALAGSASRGDASALRAFGLRAGTGAADVRAQLTHLAVPGNGEPSTALARATYQAAQNNVTVGAGRIDIALRKSGEAWQVSRVWGTPDDAARALAGAAREELNKPEPTTGSVLSLVAERRGGRWLSLRRYSWAGRVLSPDALATTQENNERANQGNVETWLRARMSDLEESHPNEVGTTHFFLQRDGRAWVGFSTVWQPPLARLAVSTSDELTAIRARRQLEREGFLNPLAHRELGRALAKLGLWNEATDALQKAEVLRPGLTNADLLRRYEASRAQDPQNVARAQVLRESRIGLARDHPVETLKSFDEALRNQGTSPLVELRYGLEHARLSDDANVSTRLQRAESLLAQGVPLAQTFGDQAWGKLLLSHLQERQKLAALKPRNLIRSQLFALRCRVDDPQTTLILAALENAQHTVYGDFSIPMSSTEVVLWGSQRAFQSYTARFAEAPTSEFVAALTLTKLINTQNGADQPIVPLVLNEEVNVYADGRDEAGVFGTIGHEYGHVAVRQLARGRLVPVWFNEGVATLVEGGYDNYRERVANAQGNNALLSMRDLRAWNVDGERAFLAYSQANSILDYIVSLRGLESVKEILNLRGQDVDFEVALQRVTGMRSDELWQAWARSLNAA